MLKLLRILIFGSCHEHTWEIHQQLKTVTCRTFDEKPLGYANIFIQKCSICGKMKLFKVINRI